MPQIGLTYHHKEDDTTPYWDEATTYRFSSQAMEALESATTELHGMCMTAVEHVLASDSEMERFGVPPHLWSVIRDSWNYNEPALYGVCCCVL